MATLLKKLPKIPARLVYNIQPLHNLALSSYRYIKKNAGEINSLDYVHFLLKPGNPILGLIKVVGKTGPNQYSTRPL